MKASGTNRVVLVSGQSAAVRLQGVTYTGRRVTCNTDLKSILKEAYSVADHQIVGPDWIASNTYEVIAVAPEGTSKETARRMLQTALEERFGLRFHREKRDTAVQALVVAKGGFKGRPADPTQSYRSGNGPGMLTSTSMTFGRLAEWLSRIGSTTVVDLTGLDGAYQIDLHWQPDDGESGRGFGLPGGLTAALADQVGVRVEKRTLAIDFYVIDQIDKTPTGN